ncbi:MAG TPA: AmmeMemoRadiSam system radical SAM enzyme [Planctomycetes bacterium]|nr:AmmeMemoRadiSam system radical SAM enzyme [Planctomycetota bacterium]
MKKAVLWQSVEDSKVRCNLCNWRCGIAAGKTGRCGVRKNIDGVLYSLVYDKVCAANVDPIEKKPLFHFQPGTKSFSIATPGCNFKCTFCQNWQISQQASEGDIEGQAYAPADIVNAAVRTGCASIAYTYTEPTIFMELAADTGRLAKAKGLANVFVSNGFMTREAVDFAKEWLDGINIDLKSFREDYYKDLCKAKLEPVLDTIRYIAKQTDIWLELTTLVVPGENDSDDELKQIADFIVSDAGPDVPWHVSRFYPQYKMDDKTATPGATLEKATQIGKAAGLHYIYVGNLPGSQAESTFCHNCGHILIERIGYTIRNNRITDSSCPNCNANIPGYEL